MSPQRRHPGTIPKVPGEGLPGLVTWARLVVGYLQNLQDGFSGRPADHGAQHSVTGADPLTTPGKPTTITHSPTSVVGAGPGHARENHVHGLDPKLAGWTDDGTVVRLTTSTDKVGIGTASPDHPLDVRAEISILGASSVLARLRLRGFYAADPADPVADQTDYFVVDDASHPTIRWRYNDAGTVRAARIWFSGRPACRAFHSAAQSIPNVTQAALALDSERFDTLDPMHDLVTNNSRVTTKKAGKYDVGGCVEWEANATGQRNAYIRLNGATIIVRDLRDAAAAGETVQPLSTLYDFAANDYIELVVAQSSGGALNVQSTGNFSPELWATKVDD